MSGHDDWQGLFDADGHIVWQGHPTGRFRLEFDSFFGFIFMIVWSAIPVAMVIAVPASLLLGIPALFVAVAFWFFFGQHFWAMFQRRRTFYSLTNKRAFFANRSLFKRRLNSYPITTETALEIDDHAGGNIRFSEASGRQMFSNRTTRKVGFEQLADPRTVYSRIRQVQQGQI